MIAVFFLSTGPQTSAHHPTQQSTCRGHDTTITDSDPKITCDGTAFVFFSFLDLRKHPTGTLSTVPGSWDLGTVHSTVPVLPVI